MSGRVFQDLCEVLSVKSRSHVSRVKVALRTALAGTPQALPVGSDTKTPIGLTLKLLNSDRDD